MININRQNNSLIQIKHNIQSDHHHPDSNSIINSYFYLKKTNAISYIFVLFLFIGGLFQVCKCTSSVPMMNYPLPNIQSTILTFTLSGNTYAQYNYVYTKVKRSEPDYSKVFFAIYEMDYNLNLQSSYGGYKLYYSIGYTISGTTSIIPYVYTQASYMNQFKMSLLIFDNDFLYFDQIFQSYTYFFSASSSYSQTYFTKSSTYEVLRFLEYCYIRTSNVGNGKINILLDSTSNPTDYTFSPTVLGGSLAYGYASVRILIVYPLQATKYSFSIQTNSYLLATPLFSFDIGFINYDLSNSVYLIGLQRFVYDSVNDPSDQGFVWTNTISSNSTNQMIITTAIDDQFLYFRNSYLMINFIHCPTDYKLIGQNRSITKQQCFDACYQNQYISYDITNKYLTCIVCPDPLCKTCQNPTQCSSCITAYDLVQTTQTCTLNSGYYDDGSGNILPCDNLLTGCTECSSDGSSCSACKSQYFVDGTVCTLCANFVTDCLRCNSTHCLDCSTPKVLINETLCSDPVSSQPLPGPDGVIQSCKDKNCFDCTATNKSNCLMCKSTFYKLQNGACITVCGDGLIDGSDVCDDGNTIDFDGCSSDCSKIQHNFACNKIPSLLSGISTSECYFNKEINLDILSIQKSEQQNKVNLYFKNSQPKIAAWQQIENNNELTKSFSLKIPRFDSNVSGYFFNYTASFVKSTEQIKKLKLRSKIYPQEFYSQTRKLQSTFSPDLYEYILVEISYSEDAPGSVSRQNIKKESLNHQRMSLTFDPTLSQRKIFTRSSSPLQFNSEFTLKADDNQVIQYHNADYYKMANQINVLAIVVSILCLILLFIGFVSFCIDGRNSRQMLIALQTSFIVQLTYFSLLGVGEINPLFMSMAAGLKLSSGYDLILGGQLTSYRQLLGIGIESPEISSNVNVSFILVIMCMAIGGIMLLLDKFCCNKKPVQKYDNQNFEENQPNINSKINEESDNQQQSKIKLFGLFFVFNAGFGFILFFLYKFVFFICVQIKFGKQKFSGLNIIIMVGCILELMFYSIFLCWKQNLFDNFTKKITGRLYKLNTFQTLTKNKEISKQKIKNIEQKMAKYVQFLSQDDKPQILKKVSLQAPSINIKLWYFIVILIGHFINIMACALISSISSYYGIIPILTYLINLILIFKCPIYPSTNLYRLNLTQIIGIVVQALILIRAIMGSNITPENEVGKTETSLGIYFPFSIIILLLILCLVAMIYSFYSIKKIRCCQLEFDWQKIQMNSKMKLKLQSLVIEQLKLKPHEQNDTSKLLFKLENNELCEQSVVNEQHLLMNKQEQSSFSSNDQHQFFNVPINVRKQARGVFNMIGSPEFKRKSNSNKQIANFRNIDRQINEQITPQKLKKEIKQKLLSSRLQGKLKKMARLQKNSQYSSNKDQQIKKGQSDNKLKNSKQDMLQIKSENETPSNKLSNLLQSSNTKKSEKDYIKKLLQRDQKKSQQIYSIEEQQVGYLYTDRKGYNVYEQFDMI